MNARESRSRRPLGIESLEGRIALAGGLASAVHVKAHHAEVEVHKGGKAVQTVVHHAAVAAHAHGLDDPATHDAGHAKGGVGEVGHHGGGKDDSTGHK